MKVTYISHATLKFETASGVTLLCDPWIMNEPVYNFSTWKYPPISTPPQKIVENIDYLFITHSHEDHFHVPSLNLFDRSTTILLPEYDHHPSLRAQTVERTLRMIGFDNIWKIPSWGSVKLDAQTSLTVIPSAKSRTHDWENCGFVVRDSKTVILNMNDNVSDIELCDQIVARWPSIDIGFIQSMGVSMWPGRFTMTLEEMRNEIDNKVISFAEQARMVDIVRPRAVVPFAGDFCWLHSEYQHQNWANRSTPKIFEAFLSEHAVNKDISYYLMQPDDFWTADLGLQIIGPRISWNRYLDEIKNLQLKYKNKIEAIDTWIKSSNINKLENRVMIRLKKIKQSITKDYIDFAESMEVKVTGAEPFKFTIQVDSEGFKYEKELLNIPPFQTLELRDYEMAAIIEGKLTWNIIQWTGKTTQYYRPSNYSRFLFWLEYHIDLNAKCPQVYLDPTILEGDTNPIDVARGILL